MRPVRAGNFRRQPRGHLRQTGPRRAGQTTPAFTDRKQSRSTRWGCVLCEKHSLEEELRELRPVGALDEAAAAREIAERRTSFSLFDELRAALYAAVALIVTGVGILVKEHLDRIGPLTLIFGLALAAAACYVPAIRAKFQGETRSTAADYILLLGALLVSADLGYTESQFHWLGANWSRHLLILTAIHAFTAYALDSRLVLSVALTTLAGWFGIERGPGSIEGMALRFARARPSGTPVRHCHACLARDRPANECRTIPTGVRTFLRPISRSGVCLGGALIRSYASLA